MHAHEVDSSVDVGAAIDREIPVFGAIAGSAYYGPP